MSDLMDIGALDDLGEDLGYNPFRRRSKRRAPQRSAMFRPQGIQVRTRPPLIQQVPGVIGAAHKLIPLGLGSITFVNGGATTAQLSARPQVPFRPRRIVIGDRRIGAAAPGLSTFVTSINIGTRNQLAAVGNLPTDLFALAVTDGVLEIDPCAVGQDIVFQFAISAAPAVGETVTLSVGMFGEAVG